VGRPFWHNVGRGQHHRRPLVIAQLEDSSMTRIATGDVIKQKPTNNVYTGLVVGAVIIVAMGLVYVFLRAQAIFTNGLM
jgi:hypothetical protein